MPRGVVDIEQKYRLLLVNIEEMITKEQTKDAEKEYLCDKVNE